MLFWYRVFPSFMLDRTKRTKGKLKHVETNTMSLAPTESRPLLHESRPNLKVLILVVFAVLFAAVAWLATETTDSAWAKEEFHGE